MTNKQTREHEREREEADRESVTHPKNGIAREWLIANRLGDFAMGTPERLPARKYHGLLVARLECYEEPHHLFAEVNEVLRLGTQTYALGCFQYDGAIHPQGFQHLEAFNAEPAPTWRYRLGDALLTRRLRLHPETHQVRLEYELENAGSDAELLLFPYFTCRNAHHLHYENAVLDGRVAEEEGLVRLRFYRGFPGLFMQTAPHARFQADGFWNYRVCYEEEAARGYLGKEDYFCPGHFSHPMGEKDLFRLDVGVWPEDKSLPPFPAPSAKPLGQGLVARLERAADAFVIRPGRGYASVVAGYPWFGEWGRDTFISLAGLTLARGKRGLAARVLDTFRKRLKHGLIPNILARDPMASNGYSVDASLWFIRAVQEYEAHAGAEKVKRWEPVVLDMLNTMLQHKVKSIHVRPSGLLYASSHPRPLTWMDARVDGIAVTPRSPFAVDVNALFYNAVRYALEIAKRRGRRDFVQIWRRIAASLRVTFQEAFWLEEAGYLADSHNGAEPEPSLRPNQLLALALPFRVVSKSKGRSILKIVRARLMTPYGPRTLDPEDPAYQGKCAGDVASRDRAYHQGTVWPWLLGPYFDAVLNVEGPAKARKVIASILQAFERHLDRACLGQVSEIFDGDAPHHPRGAPAQAWSLAELLRIALLARSLDRDLKTRSRRADKANQRGKPRTAAMDRGA